MRRTWLALPLLALAAAACSSGQPPPRPVANAFANLRVDAAFHTYHVPSPVAQVQSIVQVDPDEYLMSDYFDVFRLARNARGYSITRLGRPAGVPIWSPAGLAYRDGLLYVANNLGHDVLALRVAGDGLALDHRIVKQGTAMRTPRNVAVEPDGSVVVADYSGDAVLRFSRDGALDWSVPMPGAGGVTESGGFVYATSTSRHTIDKLDPSGKVVKAGGSYGWSRGRFVFPVGLAGTGAGVVVSDAVTGRIAVLDRDLRLLEQVGGNGPGVDAFDYPYATLPVAGGYLVVDTYKGRVLVVDRSWTIKEQVVFGQAVPAGRRRPLVSATDGAPTSYATMPGVDVVAELGLRPPLAFTGGFDGLDYHSGPAFLHLNFDDSKVPVRYVTWAQRTDSTIVIGSPQVRMLEVIDRTTGMFTYVDVGLDTWWRAGWLVYPGNLRRELADVVKPAVASFTQAQQMLAAGASREDAFNKVLNGGQTRDWGSDITSAAGKQFLASGRTKTDASRYYESALRQSDLRVAELLAVKYLSGP